MKRDLNCFDPNSIELCIFCGLYFDFVLLPVFKYKALVGVSSSSIWVLYQSRIFPCSHGAKKHHRLVLFWARTLQSFYYFFYVFFHGACKPCNEPETSGDWSHKYHKTALLFITRYLYETFLYLLSLIGIFSVICLFWHTLTARDTRDRDANSSCQNNVTWCDCCRGNIRWPRRVTNAN